MPSDDCCSFAEEDGMIETMVDLGEPGERDEVIARVHSTGAREHRLRTFFAKMTGMLAARHFPGPVKAGDCASVVAVEV